MKISIITVCYNSASTIEETIKSVLTQTHPKVEYIIIDGASSDNTLDIIRKYEDSLIYVSEPDNGLYDAMNKGLKKATGDIIGILNADDMYQDENVLATVSQSIGKADALYADLVYVEAKNTRKIVRHWKSGKYKPGAFVKGWMPPHPTFFVKREIYTKYGGFNTNLQTSADYEIMLRFIHRHGISLSYLPQVITRMRTGGQSNASLRSRLKANREDKLAWYLNGLKPAWFTLYAKPLRKLNQFMKRG